jgi:transposase-like protein
MTRYEDAKAALEKLFRQLERINPSAARSLEEGMEETLTLHRLGVGTLLRRSLATTNIIESCFSTVEHVARNVKRWQGGDHIARWTAAGLLEAEKKFRKVKGYRELKELARKLNPHSTPQQQVA